MLLVVMNSSAQSEEEPKNKRELISFGRKAAKEVCKLIYGNLQSPNQPTSGKRICGAIEYPLAYIQEHEPEWWKSHESSIFLNLEDYMRDSRNARLYCSEHSYECYGLRPNAFSFQER
jgi:hypothetical protein